MKCADNQSFSTIRGNIMGMGGPKSSGNSTEKPRETHMLHLRNPQVVGQYRSMGEVQTISWVD